MVHNLDRLEDGENILCQINGKNKEMLMDVTVEKLEKNQRREYLKSDKEIAILLLTGQVKINWLENSKSIERKSVFDEDPWCLHVPKNVGITVEASENSEILIQSTENLDFLNQSYIHQVNVRVKSLEKGLGMVQLEEW